jgi:1,2-diacylglycerol 3-alpha-glucosyltransferase
MATAPVPFSTALIWIDWYAYHVARFRALAEHPALRGRVTGIELVGGSGMHRNMVFRCAEREGLPIKTLLPNTNWSEANRRLLAGLVWQALDELNPAVVLVPGYYTAPGLAAALWAKRNGRRSILMSESTREDHNRVWWKEAAKRRLVGSLFDGAIAGGRRHTSYLTALGIPPSQIGRFYDVVDNAYFRRGSAQFRKSGPPLSPRLPENYFLYVGRLAPEKNLETLIHSFTNFRRQGGRWSLVLVGDGPQRTQLQELVTRANLAPWVRFEGLKSTPELLPYYAFAGCFVLPSRSEPWGLVANEAMASGLPVLISQRCGCADDLVVPGKTGFLFDPESTPQLTRMLLHISQYHPADLDRMGIHAQEHVSQYSPQHWAEEVYRLADTASYNTSRAA